MGMSHGHPPRSAASCVPGADQRAPAPKSPDTRPSRPRAGQRPPRTANPSRSQTKAMIIAHGPPPRRRPQARAGHRLAGVGLEPAPGLRGQRRSASCRSSPSSGDWASELAGRRLDLLNTQDNITAGVVILRALTRSAATQDQAIAGYYQGLDSVQHNGMYADTKAYVANIKALRKRM